MPRETRRTRARRARPPSSCARGAERPCGGGGLREPDQPGLDRQRRERGRLLCRGATASAGPFGRVATLGAGAVSYPDTGLASSTAYYYRLQAYNAAGTSAYSDVTFAVTPSSVTVPAAPSALAATAASASQIALSWTDNSERDRLQGRTGERRRGAVHPDRRHPLRRHGRLRFRPERGDGLLLPRPRHQRRGDSPTPAP